VAIRRAICEPCQVNSDPVKRPAGRAVYTGRRGARIAVLRIAKVAQCSAVAAAAADSGQRVRRWSLSVVCDDCSNLRR